MNKITTSHALATCSAIGDLDAYIKWTQSIPRLTTEQEDVLIARYTKEGDMNAGRELILSHLRFVVFVTRSYLGYGLPQADLIQEGNLGLLKAFKRFDPTVGVRFVSFAVYWVKSEIQEFILKNWRLVKIATTKAQRKLFFKMRSLLQNIRAMTQDDATYISQTLDVPEKDVWNMQEKLTGADLAIDLSPEEENSPKGQALLASFTTPTLEHTVECENKEGNYQHQLRKSLATLDARSQDIITQRWLTTPKQTLHDLARKYSVSAERIRQLENNALKKLKQTLSLSASMTCV